MVPSERPPIHTCKLCSVWGLGDQALWGKGRLGEDLGFGIWGLGASFVLFRVQGFMPV